MHTEAACEERRLDNSELPAKQHGQGMSKARID